MLLSFGQSQSIPWRTAANGTSQVRACRANKTKARLPFTHPVHDVFDTRVPVLDGLEVSVGINVRDRGAVLVAVKGVGVPITDTEDQIACALRAGDALIGLRQSLVELQDVAQEKCKGVAPGKVGLLAKAVVRVAHADLRDRKLR